MSEGFFKAAYEAASPDISSGGSLWENMVEHYAATGAPVGNAFQWDAVFEDGDLYKSGLCGQAL